MPGGKIAHYSGILTSLKLTDDEVAIVMGREIAHALREHGRERAAKSSIANVGAKLAGVGLSALLGIDSSLTHAAAGGVANLTMLKFSRDDETEAGLVGLDIAARAGYDPRAGIVLWQKMGLLSKGAPPQWLSTHPAGSNRIAEMRKHLPEVMSLYAGANGRSWRRWRRIKAMCRGWRQFSKPASFAGSARISGMKIYSGLYFSKANEIVRQRHCFFPYSLK